MLRGRPCTVEPLPGGLTNRNYKVTTPDGAYVLRHSNPSSADELAVDRWAEYENSVRAAATGVGAPVVDFLPDDGVLVVGFLEGETLTDEHLQRPGILPRVALACRRLHAGEPFVNRFDMFELQADYLGPRPAARLPPPAGLPRPRRDDAGASGTPSASGPWRPGRATTTCWPPTSSTTAGPSPSSTTSTRATTTPTSSSATSGASATSPSTSSRSWSSVYDGALTAEPPGAGPPVGPHVPVRMDAVGVDPGRHQPDRVRLLVLGDGEVRAGRGHLRRSRPRAAPGRRDTGRLSRGMTTWSLHRPGGDLPDRARVVIIGGGVIGTSTAYHLARLGLDRRPPARAGTALVRHDVARGGPPRPAPGDRVRHPPRAVLRPPLRRARGGDGPRHRPQAVRRRDRGAHARADGPAPPDGGHGRGLRPRMRAADPPPGPRALPHPRDGRSARRPLAARRRHRQPGRRDGLPRPRGPPPGRPHRGAHPGDRRHHAGRPGDRRRDRPGCRRGRGGRELRRPVGEGRRPPVRRRRPPPLGRALLRGDRGASRASTRTSPSCATPTGTRTSRRRSAVSSSADSSRRQSRGSPPTRCRTRSSSSSSRRTGTTSASSWNRPSTGSPPSSAPD